MRLNPHIPERTAHSMAILVEAAQQRIRERLEAMRPVAAAILQRMGPLLQPADAENEMRLSGAMAGECRGEDLDHRHMPDPPFFIVE